MRLFYYKYTIINKTYIHENNMTIDNFRENAILINEEPFVDIVGSSAYFVNTEWKRKADLEIAYNNGYSDAEYKI